MKKSIKIVLIISLFTMMIIHFKAEATTLKEYEDQVTKYTKELEEKQSKLAKNESEVKEIKQNIAALEKQIQQAEQDIIRLEEEIEQSNEEIKQKSAESESLIEYYQLAEGENAYLEYAFGAETITDMIYRASIVEQLTEYNDQIMKELEELIKVNEEKQEQLAIKKEELAKLIEEQESEQERIEYESDQLREAMPTIQQQIDTYKQQVEYWKSKGCKSNDVLGVTCAVPPKVSDDVDVSNIMGANGFRLPMNKGYLTQDYKGLRHLGVDFGSTNKSEPIYPVASGQVIYVGQDSAGANMVKIVHNVNGKLIFSTYGHMRAVYFRKGQIVSTDDMLGLMGSTGNSTGPHLHLEMTTCDWTYNCTYKVYKNSTISPWTYLPKVTRW